MSIKIQQNLMALQAQRQNSLANIKLQSSLAKLSSGYRINSAADDAAGLAISEAMRAAITGTDRAMMNAQDGVSLVQTAEGALSTVHSALNRLSELATQASNGIYNDSQRAALQNEANSLLSEIDRISKATNFNGIPLLDGSLSDSGQQTVQMSGLASTQTPATQGQYDFNALADQSGVQAGDSVSFSMALNNGQSFNISFTMNDDLTSMTANDGTVYQLDAANPGVISGESMAQALAGQLQSAGAGEHFEISQQNGAITLQNKRAGTAAPQVAFLSSNAGGVHSNIQASITAPTDTVNSVAKESFTLFDGSNEAAATFSVNGQSFVLVNNADYASTVSQLQNQNVNIIQVNGTSGDTLSADDLKNVSAIVNQKTGLAFEADADTITMKSRDGSPLNLQVGTTANNYDQISVSVGNMSSAGLGLSSISLLTQEGAASALSQIRTAIDRVSTTRGDLGATQNRLDYTINNLAVTSENLTASESRIRDADMAKMFMDFTKNNILAQTSQAMMAQANTQAQQVLQFLR